MANARQRQWDCYLFGKNPNRFLPQAGLDTVANEGLEKEYTAKERLSLRGAMVRLDGEDGSTENGLWENAAASWNAIFRSKNWTVKIGALTAWSYAFANAAKSASGTGPGSTTKPSVGKA